GPGRGPSAQPRGPRPAAAMGRKDRGAGPLDAAPGADKPMGAAGRTRGVRRAPGQWLPPTGRRWARRREDVVEPDGLVPDHVAASHRMAAPLSPRLFQRASVAKTDPARPPT